MVWPPQTAWRGKENRKSPPLAGSGTQLSHYDALEFTLSRDLSAYALLDGKPLNPKTENPES